MASTEELLGKRVAELRRARGWTQEELAEEVGVDTSYVARVEGGRMNLTLAKIAALAEALEVAVRDLFAWASQPAKPPLPALPKRLASAASRLTRPDLELVSTLAERLARRRPRTSKGGRGGARAS